MEEYFVDKFVLAHDFLHAKKVAYFAKLIASKEGYDEKEAEAAGLLHDAGRAWRTEGDLVYLRISGRGSGNQGRLPKNSFAA
jgi:HD superfamily phosphodiesterase